LVRKALHFGYHVSFRLLDAGFIAYLGPFGASNTVGRQARKLGHLQTGSAHHYAFIILVAICLLSILVLFVLGVPTIAETPSGTVSLGGDNMPHGLEHPLFPIVPALYFVFFFLACWGPWL